MGCRGVSPHCPLLHSPPWALAFFLADGEMGTAPPCDLLGLSGASRDHDMGDASATGWAWRQAAGPLVKPECSPAPTCTHVWTRVYTHEHVSRTSACAHTPYKPIEVHTHSHEHTSPSVCSHSHPHPGARRRTGAESSEGPRPSQPLTPLWG